MEDIRVLVPAEQQQLVDCARDVRIRDASVITVYTDLQELPFNKGYYTVEMTFFLEVSVELLGTPSVPIIPIAGVSIFKKKCVMYGSEGNVKTFHSDANRDELLGSVINPRCAVQVAEPIALTAKLCETRHPFHGCDCDCSNLPDCVVRRYGDLSEHRCEKGVYATIGLFIIMQMVRNVQMLIPAYDFCIPTKECTCSGPETSACDLFSTIDFPTDEFFPKGNDKGNDRGNDCDCQQ